MLSMTDTAAEAVRQLVAGSGLEPTPGLRISAGEPSPGGAPLQITVMGGPEPTDQTVEDGGATVYVESEVAEYLDDKVLDAEVADAQVRFTLREQTT